MISHEVLIPMIKKPALILNKLNVILQKFDFIHVRLLNHYVYNQT